MKAVLNGIPFFDGTGSSVACYGGGVKSLKLIFTGLFSDAYSGGVLVGF
jgi:hypothetical protein